MAYQPRLRHHQDVTPGIKKATEGAVTEYLVDSPVPVSASDGAVVLEARKAALVVGPEAVRLIAPEGTYVQLACGTVGVRGIGPFDLTVTPASRSPAR